MVQNTPLSPKRSICFTVDNTALPSSEIHVLSTKWKPSASNELNFFIGPGLVTHLLSCFKVL